MIVSDALDSLRVTSISTQNSVTLDWDDVSGIKQYEVYINGEYVETINKSEYKDHVAEATEPVVYEFRAKRERDRSQKVAAKEKAEQQLERALTPEEQKHLSYTNYSIVKVVSSIRKKGNQPMKQSKAGLTALYLSAFATVSFLLLITIELFFPKKIIG